MKLQQQINALTKGLVEAVMQALSTAAQEALQQMTREPIQDGQHRLMALSGGSKPVKKPVRRKAARKPRKPVRSKKLRPEYGGFRVVKIANGFELHLPNGRIITRTRFRDLRYTASKSFGITL